MAISNAFMVGWLVVLVFNTTLTASYTYVFPGFVTQVLTQLSFQSHQPFFSSASAVVKTHKPPRSPNRKGTYQAIQAGQEIVNSLPNDKIADQPKLKGFASDKIM